MCMWSGGFDVGDLLILHPSKLHHVDTYQPLTHTYQTRDDFFS